MAKLQANTIIGLDSLTISGTLTVSNSTGGNTAGLAAGAARRATITWGNETINPGGFLELNSNNIIEITNYDAFYDANTGYTVSANGTIKQQADYIYFQPNSIGSNTITINGIEFDVGPIKHEVESDHEYTSPGSYTFTVPAGVTEISVFAVGGGGGGSPGPGPVYGGGGGGAGTVWVSGLPVSPGDTFSVFVGDGGSAGTNGQQSYFRRSTDSTQGMVAGHGGAGSADPSPGPATRGASGTALVQGQFAQVSYMLGAGGSGGESNNTGSGPGGGGGAGGYITPFSPVGVAQGGNGGSASTGGSSSAFVGGGGGGGADGGGGGVGLYGVFGFDNTGNQGGWGGSSPHNTNTPQNNGGSGGSGGNPGGHSYNGVGGDYGGGGSGGQNGGIGKAGAQGAIRVIWGGNAKYPYNATDAGVNNSSN